MIKASLYLMNPSMTIQPCGIYIRIDCPFIMVSVQDGGFGTSKSLTGRASLERYGEINPQQKRVGVNIHACSQQDST